MNHDYRAVSLRVLAVALAVAFVAQGHAALAQTQPDGEASDQQAGAFDIVVTAQKREERLQDVPVAISAVSGDQLDVLNINNPTELRYVAPSLNFSSSANVRGEGFKIRGIGTAVFSDTVEQSVGTLVDGVPLTRSGQAVADLVDIDRVEILRGPQGMLFGKNASAGVIMITTKQPQFETSLEGRVSYGTFNEVKASGTVNLGLGDTAAVRVTYARTTKDGLVHNIVRDETLNGRDSQTVRGKFRWEPTDRLSFNVIGDWGRSRQLCCAWTARTAPVGTTFATLNAASGIIPSSENLEIAADRIFFQDADTWGVSVQVDYDADWTNFTSITAYRHWDERDANDPDILPINYLNINNGNNLLNQYTQEFRLTSPSGGRIDWVAGVFLHWNDNSNRAEQTGKFGLPLPFQLGSVFESRVRNNGAAIFGQFGFRPVEKIKLIVGGRYTDEKIELDANAFVAPGAVAGVPGRYIGPVGGRKSTTNLSGRATIQFDLSDDVMFYASAGRGYKGPAFDTLGIVSATPELVEPEIPTSFELGMRTVLFNRSTVINLTAFATDYRNFQASSFDTTVTPARFLVTNAGKLRTRGIEAEVQSRPLDGLSLSVSAAYIDSTFVDFKNISCYPGQPILPLGTPRTSPRQCILISPTQSVTHADGLPLTNAPKFTYSLLAGYEHSIGDFKLNTSVNWFWRSKVNFDAAGNPLTVQPGYGLLGANVSFGPKSERWRLSFFARNLLDQRFATVIFGQPVINSPGVSVQLPTHDAYRQLGVAIDVKFGGGR